MASALDKLIADWKAASHRWRRAVVVVCGDASDVRPLAELHSDLSKPPADGVLERIVDNGLFFRANYVRIAAAWGAVMLVRNPFSAMWLAIVCMASFHALVVRRGVVNITLPSAVTSNGQPQLLATLMYPRLHVALAAGGALLLLIVGRLSFPFWLLLPPLAIAVAHAAVKAPPRRNEAQRLFTELSLSLHAALRGEEVDVDELEGGGVDDDGFEHIGRTDAMAKRVEEIREKYRPPRVPSGKRNVD